LGKREIQSMAFLSTPGMEWLYSGVTMMIPSALRIVSAVLVMIIERKLADRGERLDRHPFRREFWESAGDRRVKGAPAQAAHHDDKMKRRVLSHGLFPSKPKRGRATIQARGLAFVAELLWSLAKLDRRREP
jgi:hypothetical protein